MAAHARGRSSFFALLHPFLSSHVVARAGGHLRAGKTIANTWEIRIVSVGALDGESRTRNLDSCAEKLRRFRVGCWTIVSCRDLGATGGCGGEFMSFGEPEDEVGFWLHASIPGSQ